MKSTKEYWKVRSIVGDETDAVVLLEELEFEYCLPKWAWTLREWTKYNNEKWRLRNLIKDSLSND